MAIITEIKFSKCGHINVMLGNGCQFTFHRRELYEKMPPEIEEIVLREKIREKIILAIAAVPLSKETKEDTQRLSVETALKSCEVAI